MADASVLLGKLADEFTGRVRDGDRPDVEDYAGRHPALADRIRALFPTLLMLEGLAGPTARATGRSGETFGPYRLIREVGRGGMGVVYEAIHEPLCKRVALKLLSAHAPDAPGSLERFLREARTAAGLHHTNIVPVFDIGQVGGAPYYAMQFIAGRGLDAVLRTGPTLTVAVTPRTKSARDAITHTSAPLADSGRGATEVLQPIAALPGHFRWVADLGIQAADGLDYAHRRGVVHRDIKPSNLLLDEQSVLWITDFGLARRTDDPALTKSGALVGTPRYMSPEQAAAGQAVDHRTDVYSLGVTLYELLTRRPAFDGPTPLEVIRQILERTPTLPRAIDPGVPRDLETVVLKAMARRLEDRYASADALADDLRRWRDDRPIRARRIGPIGRLIRWSRRNPAVAGLTTAVFALLLLSAVVSWIAVFAVGRERDRVTVEKYQARMALAASRVSQARVVLQSSRSGRRWEALDLIRKAVEDSAGLAPNDAPVRTELRGLAAEALAMGRDVLVHCERTGLTFAASADGHRVARAVHDGGHLAVRVTDVSTGQEQELDRRPRDDKVFPVLALSADGNCLAMASGIGPPGLTVWDVSTGRRRDLPDLAAPAGENEVAICYRLLISPNGKHIAALRTFQGATQLVLWDAVAGGSPTILDPNALPGPITFSPDSRTLARMSKDGIILQDIAGGPTVTLPRAPEGLVVWINDLAISPTRRLLAAAMAGKGFSVGLWDLATGKFLADIPLTGGVVTHVAFSPDGERLAVTVVRDGEQIHYVRISTRVDEFRHPTPGGGPSKLLTWLADGRRLATAEEKEAVRVWEPAWESSGDMLPSGHVKPTELAVSADGRWRAVGGWDGKENGAAQIRVTDGRTGQARDLPAPITEGYRLVFRSDGQQLAAVAPKVAVLWEAETGREVARLAPPTGGEFVSGAFDAAGDLLAVTDDRKEDRAGGVWNVRTGKLVWGPPPDAGSARLSPDGRWLLAGAGGSPDKVTIYDVAGRAVVRSLASTTTDEVIDQPRFSPDGRWLFALAPAQGLVVFSSPWASLYDATTGTKRHDLTGDAFAACSAFDPAGQLLAVGHEDGAVRVWRIENGEDLFRWRPATKPVRRLTFTADGSELIGIVEGSADLPVLRLSVLRRELTAIGLGW
jgi:serine/threonine protein kinase/WD40 repeat protein